MVDKNCMLDKNCNSDDHTAQTPKILTFAKKLQKMQLHS
jgi:hypothetical protein